MLKPRYRAHAAAARPLLHPGPLALIHHDLGGQGDQIEALEPFLVARTTQIYTPHRPLSSEGAGKR